MLSTLFLLALLAAPTPSPDPRAEAITLARTALAKELAEKPENLELEKAEAVDWPDASLGCPRKGEMYAQVITAGYRVTLRAGGKTHAVHVGNGRAVVCGSSKPPSAPHR